MVRAKVDTKIYVERCMQVHGDAYDYSKVEYVNMHTKVLIICKDHGEFLQNPQLHLKGSGCRECGRQKQKETLMSKYGVDNPMKNKHIAEKMSRTVSLKTDAEKATTLSKRRSTVKERYGVNSVMQVPDVVDKIQNSIRANNDMSDIQRKIQSTNLRRYGTKHFLSSEYARDKIKSTNMKLYGGPAPMCSDEVKAKMEQTVMERYGVKRITQNANVLRKIDESKRRNNTYGKSSSEDTMYDVLCTIFGEDDVLRQYKSKAYPYSCDFYIRSRNMHIEFNGLWTHGGSWYDPSRDDHLKTEQLWLSRGTKYYKNAVNVWTDRDVKKRKCARESGLNYVVFWDNSLKDFDLWVACGCPDATDYIMEYSWLPDRIDLRPNQVSYFTGTKWNFHKYTKSYQFFEFYKNELKLWSDSFIQMRIYTNRWKYLSKLPHELTDLEILRAFKISGVYRGYSVFDTTAMKHVLDKYNIKSIFDPCAGWGERMLCSYANQVSYYGVDINSGLLDGYNRMMTDLNMQNQQITIGDSSSIVIDEEFDAVITCPPYGGIEKYTEFGAENLVEVEFLNWWKSVVNNTFSMNVTYFCFQINQAWKDKLSTIVFDAGFELIETIDLKRMVSHFNNGSREKREFESMLVFKRRR